MRPTELLGPETFRHIITILIPGFFAITPWTVLTADWLKSNFGVKPDTGPFYVLFFAACIVAGVVFEAIGSQFEVRLWDKLNEQPYKQEENWYKFLMLKYPDGEPIGHRYLRTVTLHLKFELSAVFATLAAGGGFFVMHATRQQKPFPDSAATLPVIVVLTLSLAGYMLYESAQSAQILARVRALLVTGETPPVPTTGWRVVGIGKAATPLGLLAACGLATHLIYGGSGSYMLAAMWAVSLLGAAIAYLASNIGSLCIALTSLGVAVACNPMVTRLDPANWQYASTFGAVVLWLSGMFLFAEFLTTATLGTAAKTVRDILEGASPSKQP